MRFSLICKFQPAVSRSLVTLAVLAVAGISGCSKGGTNSHPIRGKVQLPAADVKVLAGSHIEAALATDNLVRASGEIQPDGTFTLQTQQGGNIVDGGFEGRYHVRIILNDDDRKLRQQAARAVPQRYLNFQTSGLTFDVPTSSEVSLTLPSQ